MSLRLVAAVVGPAVAALGIGVATLGSAGEPSAAVTHPAKIAFVDVGQGDGVVMKIGGKFIVSDSGGLFPERVDAALKKLGATRTIDVAIMSHAHDDHARNFIALIANFGWKIKRVVMSDSAHWEGTDTNRDLMQLLRTNHIRPELVTRGQTFHWGGASWRILNPGFGEFTGDGQTANASISYLLTVNGVRALFTGDIEKRVALDVAGELRTVLKKPVDIFLATHHGSKFGSTDDLLAVAKPRWAVVSVGAGNSFHHPEPVALHRLEDAGATIWCTETNGTVTASISARGRLTWGNDGRQRAPWWSGRDEQQNGTCAGR